MKKHKKPVYIIGIYNGHNATVALLKDGRLVQCVSEERFRNKKNYSGFPSKSISYVLKAERIAKHDIARVAIHNIYGVPIYVSESTKRSGLIRLLSKIYTPVGYVRNAFGFVSYYVPFLRGIGDTLYIAIWKTIGRYSIYQEMNFLSEYFGIPRERVISFDHHLCHAAAAYYSSPYNDTKAVALTLDAEGDLMCSSVTIFEKDVHTRIAQTFHTHSLGWVYHKLTSYFGMKPGEHEYKIMGLAPYAKDSYVDAVYRKIQHLVTLNLANPLEFTSAIDTRATNRFLKQTIEEVRFDNIAGAFQRLVEERVGQWVAAAIKQTKISTIVCGGGVFMNVKANKKIAEMPQVAGLFIMPSSGDESTAVGCAQLAYIQYCKSSLQEPDYEAMRIQDLYLGPSYSSVDVRKILTSERAFSMYTVRRSKQIEKDIADLLAQGEVVARVSGRMEWGARALGNRSILANPSDSRIVKVINDKIKGRDFWMPFTPSILPEYLTRYIKYTGNVNPYYMMVTFDTTEKGAEDLQAAVHASDQTARPQVVLPTWNRGYYTILKEFEKRTGLGGILNTSFNLHGFPIVLGPKEALWVFKNCGLKYLVLEDYIVSKK